MVISEIYLTQKTYTVPPVVHAVQGETGRILWMYLQDTQLSDYDSPFEAGLYFKRSDGTYYNDTCMTDVNYNRCEAALDQALTQPGTTRCQLKITDAAGECSTYDFNIIVHESMNGVSEEQLGYSLEEIQEIIAGARNSGPTESVKQALLACFNNVAWKITKDPDNPSSTTGEDLIDALESALYPPAELQSISATYTQSGTVYDSDSLDSLRTDLVVTANYDNGTSEVVTTYTLSGTLTVGTSTITVAYGGKTTTFDVVVSEVSMLYPLYEGTFDVKVGSGTKIGTATITKGTSSSPTHVAITLTNNAAGGQTSWINFTSGETGTNAAVNSQPTWFTMSANETYTLTVSNTVNASSLQYSVGMRNANVTSNTNYFSTGNTDGVDTKTPESDTNMGCMLMWLASATFSGKTIEFDCTFTDSQGRRYF